MARQALIVWGGWEGHQPELVAHLFRDILLEEGFEVEVSDTLERFNSDLSGLSLIVPVWTMGKIQDSQLQPVLKAVESGVGIAGCHGGMCDSFRESTDWQFMAGGQWVAHPGGDGVEYTVHVLPGHEITEGISDFQVASEQYYMHVDPAVRVLAATRFPVAPGPHANNGAVEMPVIWTKAFGEGRVFYCSLGHQRSVVEAEPARTLMKRGFLWASRIESP